MKLQLNSPGSFLNSSLILVSSRLTFLLVWNYSEASGAIRTVASLTREKDAVGESFRETTKWNASLSFADVPLHRRGLTDAYSKSLDIPLQAAKRTLIYSNALYALSQSLAFFVIALVFFIGSRWIADFTISLTAFFTTLMSVVFGAIQAGNVFSFVSIVVFPLDDKDPTLT